MDVQKIVARRCFCNLLIDNCRVGDWLALPDAEEALAVAGKRFRDVEGSVLPGPLRSDPGTIRVQHLDAGGTRGAVERGRPEA